MPPAPPSNAGHPGAAPAGRAKAPPHARPLPLRVGTRGSPLALWQTRYFLQRLTTFCPVLRAMDVFEEFNRAVVVLPQVLECHLVSGDFDYLIKARVPDMAAYRRLLGETLLTLPHVSGSRSYAVMEEVKETLELEVD